MTPRLGGDDGTGLIGSFTGLVVFLVLLSFAAQLLLTLSATTAVSSAGYEAARVVARGGPTGRGEERARALLGRLGEKVHFDWSSSTTDTVVLRMRADAPRLAPALTPAGPGRIDRTVRIRVERWR